MQFLFSIDSSNVYASLVRKCSTRVQMKGFGKKCNKHFTVRQIGQGERFQWNSNLVYLYKKIGSSCKIIGPLFIIDDEWAAVLFFVPPSISYLKYISPDEGWGKEWWTRVICYLCYLLIFWHCFCNFPQLFLTAFGFALRLLLLSANATR